MPQLKLKHFITIVFLFILFSLRFYINQIDINNEGYNHFSFQLSAFLGVNNYHKKWGFKRDIDFQFYPEELNVDSVHIEITNNSLSDFYTFSFPHKLPVLYYHDKVCYKAKCDTFSGNPYGCGTGMYVRKVEKKILKETWSYNISEYLEHYVKDKIIPDSIILQKRITVFELPWSMYKKEDIYSNKLVLTKSQIERLLDN
jgi:hypothetical protein